MLILIMGFIAKNGPLLPKPFICKEVSVSGGYNICFCFFAYCKSRSFCCMIFFCCEDNWENNGIAFEKKEFSKWELYLPPKQDGSCPIDHLSELKVVQN